ncbi:GNAT family N-acetyltransferase [Acidihalobacter ferrooxydans]|uniref:GNAT family N-acetyltransferase n=1 Tax=Acidihalobacter ferrooxydans TaxID=1765967 RepID=A0A1P8UKZ7_9GAMM|nr:GNAT family N-acetyltransferase [Acidihalobacter ferrooxydans]
MDIPDRVEAASAAPDDAPANVVVDCGWGRVLFGQTFADTQMLAAEMQNEDPGRRDIALYAADPHVLLSYAPQELFLDPSHTFRLQLDDYAASDWQPERFEVVSLATRAQAEAAAWLYMKWEMIPPGVDFVGRMHESDVVHYWIARDKADGAVLGVVQGLDHVAAFDDPQGGSSLWALAVDPQAPYPGIGEALVRCVAEAFKARGRAFLDLSVMHNNVKAIALYEKLGFKRLPVFSIKNRNAFNETLFLGPQPEEELGPYATIITDEARRRGIGVEVLDAEADYFALTLGGRRIVCRQALTELTTAVAMSRCDDKEVTRRLLERAGLRVPQQMRVDDMDAAKAFLSRLGRVVVKPARGEQGAGIAVDVRDEQTVEHAIVDARHICATVLLEEFVEGEDLRIIVIGYEVVAAAVRRPPSVVGTGRHTVRQLIQALSRRRRAATSGESTIPLDGETERCVRLGGYGLDDVLPAGTALLVRKTANLHTGGTIHDVTPELHPALAEAAIAAARAIDIPVTGIDLLVPSVSGPEYAIIEANERPGLANHEPQPTAERFVDLLFPQTANRESLT